MRRLLLATCFLLLPAIAHGAVLHVTSNDPNCDGVANQGFSCTNHADVTGGSDCGLADGTLAAPYCTIQAAVDAMGAGDVVEIHAGCYDYNLDGTSTSITYKEATRDAFVAVKLCASCDTEANRRYIRGACKTGSGYGDKTCRNGTLDDASRDRPHLKDLSSPKTIEQIIALGTDCTNTDPNCNGEVGRVTIQTLEMSSFTHPQVLNAEWGIISEVEKSDYTVFDDFIVHTLTCSGCDDRHNFLFGVHHGGIFRPSVGTIIKNMDFDVGGQTIGFVSLWGREGTANVPNFIIHDNKAYNMQHRAAAMKGACGVFYNNWFETTGGSNEYVFIRDNTFCELFFFNNILEDSSETTFYQRNNDGDQYTHWFNNTAVNPSGDSGGDFLSDDIAANVAGQGAIHEDSRVVNNLAETGDFAHCQREGPVGGNLGYNAYSNNEFTLCTGKEFDLGNDVTTGAPWITGTGSKPTPYFEPASGTEDVVDAGTNDPLGQGAGVCSIDPRNTYNQRVGAGGIDSGWNCDDTGDPEACDLIDCSLDFKGTDRDTAGTGWDIGAIEFVSATPACNDGLDNDGDGDIDFPADQGCVDANDTSELGTNECDDGVDNDGDGATDTADSGCATSAGTDETDCGDNKAEGGACPGAECCDGTDLQGNDCTTISGGFTGGTLACNGTCDDWDTSSCISGSAPTANLSGAVLKGGTIK